MIESFATATPVIAFHSGSVPEVIEEGVTGYVVSSVEEAVEAVSHLDWLSRKTIRAEFEKRFTASVMTGHYLSVYEMLIEKKMQERSVYV